MGYGVAANAVMQEASEIHMVRLTPGTKVVVCRGWHLWRKFLLLLKSLFSFPLTYNIYSMHPLHYAFLNLLIFFPSYLTSCLFRSVYYCFSGIYLLTSSSRVGFTCLILLCSWGNIGRKGAIKSIHFMERYKHVFSWIDGTEYKTLLIYTSP